MQSPITDLFTQSKLAPLSVSEKFLWFEADKKGHPQTPLKEDQIRILDLRRIKFRDTRKGASFHQTLKAE
jgi:hypothetical protein